MVSVPVALAIWILTAAFAAGGAWFTLRESQRHVNGLGAKVNAMEKQRNDRHARICIAIMALAQNEHEKEDVTRALSGEQI